jgi:hypothetical protein
MERVVPELPAVVRVYVSSATDFTDEHGSDLVFIREICGCIEVFLLVPVGNASARQVVGRHLDTHAITNQNPDAILSHLTGDGGQDYVFAVVEPDFEKCVGLFIDDDALGGD